MVSNLLSIGSRMLAFFLVSYFAVPVTAGILHAGDVLEILVKDHKELTKKVIMKSDGTIEYPFLEDHPLLDMTPMEVGELLTFRLAKHIVNPFVLVTKSDNIPIKIRVLGQVKKPGIIQLNKGATLQEVLMAAGGPDVDADLAGVKIIREKGSDADAIRVNYKVFLQNGMLDNLPEIRNNDTVILLSSPRNLKLKVLGCVSRPGYYKIQGETNIFDAIYLAGGPAAQANLSKVRHILKSEGKNVDEIVDLQDYLDRGKIDDIPKVKEGDVIVVYKKLITWSVFLSFVRDALMLFTAYHVFAG